MPGEDVAPLQQVSILGTAFLFGWDQEFESGFLQRRVRCERDFGANSLGYRGSLAVVNRIAPEGRRGEVVSVVVDCVPTCAGPDNPPHYKPTTYSASTGYGETPSVPNMRCVAYLSPTATASL
jgi:hypothetical protein